VQLITAFEEQHLFINFLIVQLVQFTLNF
jgi:hypothetical protein